MAIVVVKLNDSSHKIEDEPLRCVYCGSTNIQRWGQTSRGIYDLKKVDTTINRYYCNTCKSTFRYYPKGIGHSRYSERVRRLAALIWLMDLSVRDVVEVFEELGVSLNRMIIWREGQKLVQQLNSLKFLDPNQRYSIDKSGGVLNRKDGSVLLVLSLKEGKNAILGSVNTKDPYKVIAWLQPILKEMNVQITTISTKEFS
jgi:transposase-like protein